ncbi:hypothetical protein PR202_gb20521 [Eleusine coracana subsp. coracana]|uniref:Uncharacterized protein n=1 Tax=Eleusine coracana subsp. coracana TaxID=191504 RepID=A0AAV5F8R7_ELECO|nr:hypothetical protein PR202_gb20521 [Eleusine coracana subsp. coracana]
MEVQKDADLPSVGDNDADLTSRGSDGADLPSRGSNGTDLPSAATAWSSTPLARTAQIFLLLWWRRLGRVGGVMGRRRRRPFAKVQNDEDHPHGSTTPFQRGGGAGITSHDDGVLVQWWRRLGVEGSREGVGTGSRVGFQGFRQFSGLFGLLRS